MFKKLFSRLLFFILFFVFQSIHAQLSKKHFIPPLTSAEFGNANPENQYFYISTPSSQNVSYTIIPVGQPSTSEITGVVSNTSPQEIFIGTGATQLFVDSPQTSIVTNNKGYIVESDDVIYVSIRMLAGSGSQAGALVSKGSSALGSTFRVGSFTNESPGTNYLNFVSVMATEDATNVTFSDIPTGISIKNYAGTLPINITLNEGESYIVATNSSENTTNRDGLIGALVQSDKPIVVNTGSANGSFHNGSGRDYGIDQIVGVDKIGSEYIFVKGDGSDGWENALIVAHQDNTTISINGNASVTTINAGDYYLIEGNNFNANGNMFVETSNPVFAYQGIGANASEANQGLFFVPPLSCENRGQVDNIPAIQSIGTTTFTGGITIVTNKGATVTINGLPVSNFTTAGPFDVDGNPNYVTYKVTNLTNNVSIQSSEELYCAYFNQNGAATSGSFYSGFPSAPEINFDATVATLGNCIPNVTLDAANTDLFDTFEWYFDDEAGGGFISTGNTNTSYTPSSPGRYKLVATIICTGAIFESIEVPVSLCPDDYDGDLIIDNLDVDLDNDGILNCDESLGDATINILDINTPNIVFQDGSTNSAIISSVFTQTNSNGVLNTFIGEASGNFESTLIPASDTKLQYELNFTQNINFKFTQNETKDHTISDGEFFILKIGPNNKNITLLDPDDQLLVDTNFDGEFEAGIINISASEIHFKYAANTTGAASTFEFVANQVDQIDFKHQSTGITTNSVFNGTIILTCFGVDSDGDGIENAFDIDSDNDGIPDINEATASTIILANNDANLDGLDDVFNGVLTNTDTDLDGVLNYLDLDSDNDGIYDLEEAGHASLDANLDGVIDNANTTSGTNGLVDALETVPDNTTLSYTIADTDADANFNFLELDSDNDTCFDVTEAGFTDVNVDGFLGVIPIQVDANGKVLNAADGYTNPNSNYITSAPILLNTPFEDVAFCEASTSIITIDTNADAFQWEESSDGISWSNVVNNTIYNGATTTSLQISNLPLSFNNYQYRVVLERTGNSCSLTSNAITLTVNPLPTINAIAELKQCDTDIDGFSDFNLYEAASDISSNHLSETFIFYPTLADANADTNAYTPAEAQAFENRIIFSDTVWARTISNFGCYRVSEVTLTVSATGIPPTFERSFTQCDDFLDIDGNDTVNNDDTDGVSAFDFSSVTAEVLALFPPGQPLTVTYYRNEADALAEINAITDPSNYRNIGYPNSQTIYVRVDSDADNDCVGFGPHVLLNVDPVPTASSVGNLEFCDDISDGDGTNGVITTFDLESQTATILGAQNPANYTVTYHALASEALSGANPLTSPYRNTTPNQQTIYVRVTNVAGCYTNHTSFDLIVNPLPVANFVDDLEVCDDDSDGSARNGFSQTIDLESQTATILGGQDPTNFTVTYHKSLALAQAGTNPLPSPFSNEFAFRETIYVRVYNSTTMCANGISNFDVIVNPEPTRFPVNNLSYCDDDTDGDDTNGIIQSIDLDSQIEALLGTDATDPTTQQPADFNVSFHSTQAAASSGSNPLTSPYTNTTTTETIFVRIENKATMCVNDDASFQVIVNPLPDFRVTTPDIVCLNILPKFLSINSPLDVYDYQWKDPNGNVISSTDTAEVQVSTTGEVLGGNYTVRATTTDGTMCSRERTVVVNKSNIATITEEDVTIIDEGSTISTNDNLSIQIDNTNNNLGIGDYQYALEDENGILIRNYQDAPLFENLEGGIYNILVNDKNGCGKANLLVSVLQFPKFFTPNFDGRNDTWAVKGANPDFYPESSIRIFNRYGKLLVEVPLDSQGWDGNYNSQKLPSDDYWFNITLVPPATSSRKTINKTGHFSLLRK